MYQQVRVFRRSLRAGQWSQIRHTAHSNTKNVEGEVNSQEWSQAKPFSEIPGPTAYQLVRGLFPGGVYYKKTALEFTLLTRKIYGDIYKLPGFFGKGGLVVTFNPDDFALASRSEGVWPKRRPFETIVYHRTVERPEFFGDFIGILSSNDEAWGKIRSLVNPLLMQPRIIRLYLNKMLEVSNEFLQRIREIRDPKTLEMPDTFEDELNRLTFESVAVVALNQQIGLIRKNRNDEDAKKLFANIRKSFSLMYELDMEPSLWKMFRTPKFNECMKTYDTICNIVAKYVNQAVERIESNATPAKDDEEKSVLEKLLKIDRKIATVMAMDMLVGGVDTTSSTLVGILLCIAKNPEKQEKLRQEIRTILPQKDSLLTVDNMKNLPYLRACIKEGIRMYPIGIGTLRTNAEDIVLSGYQVPKLQQIIVGCNAVLMEDKHVPRAKEFIPERWLRDEKSDVSAFNPFLYMPFGFGPRSCVGKRIVDLELEMNVSRLVRNFNIEFNYPVENAFKNVMINVPAIPLKFKFSEVED